MDKAAIPSLMQQVQDQLAKTTACPRHDFGEYARIFGRKYRCQHCGCEWRLHEIGVYIRGYEAAGGDGNDILRGWAPPSA